MDRSLRAARLATFVYFILNGTVMGMWVVQIPTVEHRTGISHAVLGELLLLLAFGAFVGMRVAGPLADRFGARVMVPAGAALCSATLALPGLATGAAPLTGALFVFGLGNGVLDVSMNTHAVQVEHAYRRPILAVFHAAYSLGGVLAALAGARAISAGWTPATTLGTAAVIGAVIGLATAPLLLRRPAAPAADPVAPTTGPRGRRTSRRIWGLAALALMVMLSEGVANDWSTLHLRTVLDAAPATAALAYGAFSVAMTVGRLLTDRTAARFGAFAVLRYGAAIAAVGLTVAALSSWIPLALVGWALFGAGLSGCVPQLFSAAGHVDAQAAGANVSRVASLGYLGMLAGPAVIGWLTHLMPLTAAFFLPIACCAAAALAAGLVRPPAVTGTASDVQGQTGPADAGALPPRVSSTAD
ncbi:MFS transporter [Streptacidiphilus carbonis]|uniref:MFS transporter n=1 Tax=Streptacidiphilus carbonis TaxID=105422 RepID=UPI0007C7DB2E|nr:MFS transporter [Streptacidiphilus carbonis]